LGPEPKECTILSVNDNPRKNTNGRANNPRYLEFIFLFPDGKSMAKKRNAVGIIPDAANPILPQNSIEKLFLRK
jgi:hypothetical protein